MRLSCQEQNLVSIYHSGSRFGTVCPIREALPYMDEGDVQAAHLLLGKLERMSDSAFAALTLEEVAVSWQKESQSANGI